MTSMARSFYLYLSELFSELTESPIARQSECDRELFSELAESPPPPLKRQKALWGSKLLEAMNPKSTSGK